MPPRRSPRVPAARVVGLKDLQARMATANDLAYHLDLTSVPEDFQTVMKALEEAYWIAADLAHQRSKTGCTDHPHGPVDPVAPEGWSSCLFCNNNRRRGVQQPRAVTGQRLTGATSGRNRHAERVEEARRPSPPEAARWREPDIRPSPADEDPEAAVRRERARTHAAAVDRARQDRAARKKAGTP
ncbi:hypothetical protein GCM10010387_16280 [Streptomyces inusitatus]|uniref:Uncharacterized protein n=1 Tax=Streptomyces inusitatus TaxID=68221 RepID=A0A918PWY8_9ACTN|nr:hypothetical protein [Streptomyces inusitatus]GGZ23791.1 hypothetical protein GCM10010387_16280 [Streptomyces inusitatus]